MSTGSMVSTWTGSIPDLRIEAKLTPTKTTSLVQELTAAVSEVIPFARRLWRSRNMPI